jgi:hypothetical protein
VKVGSHATVKTQRVDEMVVKAVKGEVIRNDADSYSPMIGTALAADYVDLGAQEVQARRRR